MVIRGLNAVDMRRVAQSMLAQSGRRVSGKAGIGRGACRMSTVAENTIKLNFVDVDGNRATVPGRVGQTLLDVAVQHGIDLEGACGGGGGPTEVRRTENWVETTYGEGPQCFYCHVQVPSSYDSFLPEAAEVETQGLDDVWEDEVSRTSRLACMITLRREHDGMAVYVPDAPPVDVI